MCVCFASAETYTASASTNMCALLNFVTDMFINELQNATLMWGFVMIRCAEDGAGLPHPLLYSVSSVLRFYVQVHIYLCPCNNLYFGPRESQNRIETLRIRCQYLLWDLSTGCTELDRCCRSSDRMKCP